jgi:N,N'-diacetyllegionaminate synthase
MATASEVDAAVEEFQRARGTKLVLLHCTSGYPTPAPECNMRRLTTLRQRYGVPVGFSDHTVGSEAAVQAVTLGACMIEKHFTLSHDLPGPDHWFSTTEAEFRELVEDVRAAEIRLGAGCIEPSPTELSMIEIARTSATAARDIAAGESLTQAMYVLRRPGTGLSSQEAAARVGKTLRRSVKLGCKISASDF